MLCGFMFVFPVKKVFIAFRMVGPLVSLNNLELCMHYRNFETNQNNLKCRILDQDPGIDNEENLVQLPTILYLHTYK